MIYIFSWNVIACFFLWTWSCFSNFSWCVKRPIILREGVFRRAIGDPHESGRNVSKTHWTVRCIKFLYYMHNNVWGYTRNLARAGYHKINVKRNGLILFESQNKVSLLTARVFLIWLKTFRKYGIDRRIVLCRKASCCRSQYSLHGHFRTAKQLVVFLLLQKIEYHDLTEQGGQENSAGYNF